MPSRLATHPVVPTTVPVARAADYAAAGKGKLYLTTAPSSTDDCIIKGKKTEFTKQMVVKGQIQLGKPYGFTTAEIVQVIDDETVKIRKMFGKDKAVEDLLAAGEKIAKGEEGAGLAYKTLPYIDQTKVSVDARSASKRRASSSDQPSLAPFLTVLCAPSFFPLPAALNRCTAPSTRSSPREDASGSSRKEARTTGPTFCPSSTVSRSWLSVRWLPTHTSRFGSSLLE